MKKTTATQGISLCASAAMASGWFRPITNAPPVPPAPPAVTNVPPQPPPPVPPSEWPQVSFDHRIYTSSKAGWNVSFIHAGFVAEYDNASRKNSRIVTIADGRSVWSCDSETLQAPTLGFTAAEKGSKGAPRFVGSGCQQGHKTARKISLCTALLDGRAVVFHADQNRGAKSAYDDCETGKRLGELHLTGAVIAAVPFEGVLLCALDGGAKMTCVTTDGREFPAAARCLWKAADGRILAGCQDGRIRELRAGKWADVTTTPLGGRVMDVRDAGGYLFATTDKGAVYAVRADGAAKQVLAGAVDYGGGSWFGPRFGIHDGALCVARKVKDGSKWRCVIERMEIVP
jgi:outer membrane protein assembly factor BamB